MKVSLINYTKKPIETMCYARRVMHSKVPDSLDELVWNPRAWLGTDFDTYVKEVLLQDGMPTFSEYVNFTFKLEGVSRALQQQLTRHRIGFSYSIQSLRCIDLPNFADEHQYYNPFPENSSENRNYHSQMVAIQRLYRNALADGVPTQDARGLLPMNIYSTITFSCTFRALKDMLNKRLCLKTQDEFRIVADEIVKQLNEIDPRLLNWIGPPCRYGKCMMKGENEEQFTAGKLEGKQNTDHCCPRFVKMFKEVKQ